MNSVAYSAMPYSPTLQPQGCRAIYVRPDAYEEVTTPQYRIPDISNYFTIKWVFFQVYKTAINTSGTIPHAALYFIVFITKNQTFIHKKVCIFSLFYAILIIGIRGIFITGVVSPIYIIKFQPNPNFK